MLSSLTDVRVLVVVVVVVVGNAAFGWQWLLPDDELEAEESSLLSFMFCRRNAKLFIEIWQRPKALYSGIPSCVAPTAVGPIFRKQNLVVKSVALPAIYCVGYLLQ